MTQCVEHLKSAGNARRPAALGCGRHAGGVGVRRAGPHGGLHMLETAARTPAGNGPPQGKPQLCARLEQRPAIMHSQHNVCQACSHSQHSSQQLGTLGEPSKCPYIGAACNITLEEPRTRHGPSCGWQICSWQSKAVAGIVAGSQIGSWQVAGR